MTAPQFPRLGERLHDEPIVLVSGAAVPPVAEFASSPDDMTVTFTDQSFDLDGQIVAWDWDFGDALSPPVADFTFQVTGLAVQFTDTSTDVAPGTVVSWSWNFGDGFTSTAKNPSHTYAAAGSYPVSLTVTDNNGNVSTPRQRTVLLVVAGGLGRFFGPSQGWATTTSPQPNTSVFTGFGLEALTAGNAVARLQACRDLGKQMCCNMTSGSHSNYTTNGKFDFDKWKARMQTLNTAAIRAAVAEAVSNGTLLGNSMMDEPHDPDWGGMTKALIDQMAAYGHTIFPTLPMGVVHQIYTFAESQTYKVVDFLISQYVFRQVPPDRTPEQFRDLHLPRANAEGYVQVFSMNVINGGSKISGCPLPQTGGVGTFADNCRMTPEQVEDAGQVLLPAGAGLNIWQYDAAFMAKANNQAAFANLRTLAMTLPRLSWRRS